MAIGTLTALEDNRAEEPSGDKPEGGKEPQKAASGDGAKGKEPAKDAAKAPAPERKKVRTLADDRRFRLFSGTANPELARKIGEHIGVKVGDTKLQRFADGEVFFQLLENVRGVDVFVVQPTCYPVDQHLVELLVMIDALKRASAARITVVMPYYGYARQDRKDRPRVAISAKLIADLLTTAGANRALFVDLHAAQIQGFFNIPVDHLYASPVLVSYFRELNLPNLTVVSPDAGGVERARAFSKRLDASLAIIDKRRPAPNVAELVHIIGDVKDRDAIVIDDMVDTAGTLCAAAKGLTEKGARGVYACITHGLLSGPALDRIHKSTLKELIITDSIPPRPEVKASPKVRVLSVASLLAEAVNRIHQGDSLSSLFI